MADPGRDRLEEISRDSWADPVASAHHAALAILEMLDRGWSEADDAAVAELRRRRPDSPFLLAVSEAALSSQPESRRSAIQMVLEELADPTWADQLARRIGGYPTLGVVSLGEATLKVLETAGRIGTAPGVLFTDRRAIARGLTYLGRAVQVAPPEHARVVLIPAAAVMGSRIWTTARAADVALRAALHESEVVVVAHPLASLSRRNRAEYRPVSTLIDVKI